MSYNSNSGIYRTSSLMAICVGILVGAVFGKFIFGSESHGSIDHHLMAKYSNVHWNSNRSVAQHMRKEIRILCWIMTGPQNHKTKAQHIRHTWGRHCNTLLFMSSVDDPDLQNSIPLPVVESRDFLWAKTKEAFKYIYDNHRNDADWFLKADDDSFVVMENLRSMLHPYPPEMPIFFGRKFKMRYAPKQGYMSGGAGYVLSKKAMTLLVEDGLNNASICYQGHGHAEDVEMGNCLDHLGVVAGDSREPFGRERFYPFPLCTHLRFPVVPDESHWYFKYSFYRPIDGKDAVPANAVSFHYVEPKWMYVYDYFIYNVRTFGRGPFAQPIDEGKFSLENVKEILKRSDPTLHNI